MEQLCILGAWLLCVVGIVLVFRLTPSGISEDMARLFLPDYTLREKALLISGRKKKSRFGAAVAHTREVLETTGRKGTFGLVCMLSAALALSGVIVWILTGWLWQLPVALFGALLLPFFVTENATEAYEKRLSAEMETSLAMVSSAYLRNGNLIAAVEESMPHIRPPMADVFGEFLTNATVVSPDMAACIRRMQSRIDHRIFRDWCEVLLACTEDSSNRDALLPVVQELADIRLANSEMETVITECRKEYYGMVALTVAAIPLLYLLNREWWDALLHSAAGQIVLALCGCVILLTAFLMKRYTRPLELHEKGGKK